MRKLQYLVLLLTTLLFSSMIIPTYGNTNAVESSTASVVTLPTVAEKIYCAGPCGPYHNIRVGSENLCVEQSPASYTAGMPVELSSDRWDFTELFIAHESDFDLGACWQYNYGQRISFEIVNKPNGHCQHYYQAWDAANRWVRFIVYQNIYYQTCWSSAIRKEHYAGKAIGSWLGMISNQNIYSVMHADPDVNRGPTLTHDIPSVDGIYNF